MKFSVLGSRLAVGLILVGCDGGHMALRTDEVVAKVSASGLSSDGFSIRFACTRAHSPSDTEPADLDPSTIIRIRPEYDALRQRLWAEDGRKCSSRGLALLALADPDRAVGDLSVFLTRRFDHITQNHDAIELRNAVQSLGLVVRHAKRPETITQATELLHEYLDGRWRAPPGRGHKWVPTTSAAMLDLAARELAKGAVLGMLRSKDRRLVEHVAGLQPADNLGLPRYFLEASHRSARTFLEGL